MHFYTGKKHSTKYRLLCTGSWAEPIKFKPKYPHSTARWSKGIMTQDEFTSVVDRVTCKECLTILIPRTEAKLDEMKKRLWAGTTTVEPTHEDSQPFQREA